MKRIVYIWLIVFYSLPLYAQDRYTVADSVTIFKLLDNAQKLADNAKYDSAISVSTKSLRISKFKQFKKGEGFSYNKLADIAYAKGDYPAMKLYDSLGLEVATALKDKDLLAETYELNGLYEMDKGSNSKSEFYFHEALQIKYEREQSSGAARVYINLALLKANDKEAATALFLKGIKLYEILGDESGLGNAYNNYAAHLYSLERNREALEYAKKSVHLREKLKDNYGLMYSYANISQIYTLIDSLKQALYYQQQSVQKAEEIGSDKLRAQSYVGMSLLYSRMKKFDLAFDYEQKAVTLLEQTGNTEMLSRRYIALAMGYSQKKDSASSAKYYMKAIEMSAKYDYKENLRDAYLYTAIFFKEKKNYYNAYEYLKKYHTVKDEILDEEGIEQIAELETKYETQKKEEKIQQLNNEKLIQELKLERQGLFRNVLIAAIVLALGLAYILFNRYQLKKKLEQKTAMLKERTRISSELHDEVGSTLSTINILSHSARLKLKNDIEKSDSLLEKINENSQRMMDAMSDIVWSINPENDELGNISVRMKEFASEILDNKNIDYSFHIADELKEVKLSPEIRKDMYLVFKEAVNNLAKYSKASSATISISRVNGSLDMLIEDNGTGFDISKLNSGNGMNNMKRRAEEHGGYFKIDSMEGKGTTVRLQIPIA
jgi:two-component system sensor histidine kinase UhpB